MRADEEEDIKRNAVDVFALGALAGSYGTYAGDFVAREREESERPEGNEKKHVQKISIAPVYTSHARTSPIFRTIVVCKSARAHCAARATCTYFIFSSGFYLRSPELFLYIYIYYSLYTRARPRVYGVYYYAAALWRTEIVLELQKITASDNSTTTNIIIIVVYKKGIFPRVHRV